MSQHKVDFSLIPWESPVAGVRFKAFRQGGRQLRLVEYRREFVEPDWCLKGHIGYVLEGRVGIDFDGVVVEYGPGDGIFIPSGDEHKHKATVLTDVARVVLVEEVTQHA